MSNDASNRVLNRVQFVPLTSKTGRVYPSEALIRVRGRLHNAMADQLRTVAKERLTDRMGSISQADLQTVEQAIRVQLGLP